MCTAGNSNFTFSLFHCSKSKSGILIFCNNQYLCTVATHRERVCCNDHSYFRRAARAVSQGCVINNFHLDSIFDTGRFSDNSSSVDSVALKTQFGRMKRKLFPPVNWLWRVLYKIRFIFKCDSCLHVLMLP